MKKQHRISYAIGFLILVIIEALIAEFVHDNFVRPYLGDALVVIVLYCLIRAILPHRVWKSLSHISMPVLPVGLFVFAAIVEILQGIQIVDRLGLGKNETVRTMIGTSFDWMDLLCYLCGCLLLAGWEWLERKSHNE